MHKRKQRKTARRSAKRKQRGGICPCALQQQQQQQDRKQQKGGFAVALMNQFTTAASILTPIAVALGIKAYRDTKKGKGKSSKTRRTR